ncbi:MBL fold metallo-hydrolase [Halieaceae bacterium IMCC14734]|uniref:MBL fold metallo-hydrolase n=1 Tax=Candidatus Litorirhabdus singularis TaxID=2518993 RepID=A0ABT3TJN3_9GAMM|nr:MBL fold metallo-hydrolase [Candidatus Litorirhabdus singularis]MCX2982494.1 MBL fold metallo-hydrolase [Candidatus Litorirhabdus singularis]
MRRYKIFLLLALTVLPINFLYGESEALFSGAPRGDDGRFTNPTGDLAHGSFGVRFPFILRRLGTYFRSAEGAPPRVANDGAFLRENARHSVPTVTWIGHATLLVQSEHVTFLTDPTWSARPSPMPGVGPKRFVKPGLAFADLPPIDFVLISHNHYDHLDLPTLRNLAERNADTVFFVPLGNGDLLRSQGITHVEELNWGQAFTYKGATIHCLPSQHWSKRSLTDDHKALWSSWAVTGDQRRFYFAGDTGYFSGFEEIGQKLGPFDLVAVPIGAYEPQAMMRESHMNPEEALRAALDLRAETAVAIHFGTFDLSDEPLDEPPRRFREAAADTELGDGGAWVLNIGETREF